MMGGLFVLPRTDEGLPWLWQEDSCIYLEEQQ